MPAAAFGYRLATGISFSFIADTDARLTIRGESDRSGLIATAAIDMITFTTTVPNVRRVTVKDVFLNGDSLATNGIVLNNCAYDRIINSHFANFDGAGAAGVSLEGVTSRCQVRGNIFVHHTSSAAAVRIKGTGKHNIVANNTIGEDVAYGVDLEASTMANIIVNNPITSISKVGIRATSSDRNIIANNQIEVVTDHGINLITSDWNIVRGNQIFDTGTGATGSAGVRVAGSGATNADNNQIIGNVFQSSDDYDILLVDSLVRNTRISQNDYDGAASVANVSDGGSNTSGLDERQILPQKTFADGDTTPSVGNAASGTFFSTTNTAPTVITKFDDGQLGQIIYVRLDGNTDITDGTSIRLTGGNWDAVGSNDIGVFLCIDATSSIFLELSVAKH